MFIIQVIIIISGIFNITISKLKTKSFYNSVAIFNAWWNIILLLSTFGFNGIYRANERTYLIILINSTVFSLAALIFQKTRDRKKINEKIIDFKINTVFNYKLFRCIELFIFLVCLFYLYSIICKIGINGFLSLNYRSEFLFENKDGLNSQMFVILTEILSPLVILCLYTSIFNLLLLNSKKGMYLSIINFFIVETLYRGRVNQFFLLLYVLLTISYFTSNKIGIFQFKKNFKSIKKIGLIILGLFFLVTVLRISDKQMMIKKLVISILVYFTGPIYAFDTFLNNGFYGYYPVSSYFGQAFIAGLDNLVVRFIRLFNKDVYSLYYIIGVKANYPIMITNEKLYNALYSMYVFFVVDFGVNMCWLGSLIYGCICSIIERISISKFTYLRFVLNIFMYTSICYSLFNWTFNYTWAWNIIFFMILFNKFLFKRKGY